MGRVVSPTPTPLSSGRVVPALVASYDMHGRAVGLFYTQPTGQCHQCPHHKCIYEWIKKFRTHETVLNLNAKGNRKTHSGQPKTSRTLENIAAARDSVVRSPSKSLRRQELGIDRESVRRILITDLHLYPYQIQIKHKLTPDDMRKRVTMHEWFCGKIDEDPDFLDNVWFSDEAHFPLSGHVNSKTGLQITYKWG